MADRKTPAQNKEVKERKQPNPIDDPKFKADVAKLLKASQKIEKQKKQARSQSKG